MHKIVAAIVMSSSCMLTNAGEAEWPKLHGSISSPSCQDAYVIAKTAFASTKFEIYDPSLIPAEYRNQLVFGPSGLDLSNGDALQASEELFERILDPGGGVRSYYWQRKAIAGQRLVVTEYPLGWRGDLYDSYILPSVVRPQEFSASLSRLDQSPPQKSFSQSWRPLVMFKARAKNALWLIRVGAPYEGFGDWTVYSFDEAGFNERCTIQFQPVGRDAKKLLPADVRKLAYLLDETMGTGENEGTLNPTGRLRVAANGAWFAAMVRPWALPVPYNSRESVDEGLASWAQSRPSYARHYNRILKQYPIAERALAKYYEQKFGKPRAASRVLAAQVLDTAIRNHYVFSERTY